MSPLYLQDGKLLIENSALAINQNCCCQPCECGPINCTVTFSVDGVEFTWNITGYPNSIGDFAYAEQEFFLDPYENLCEDINNRYTAIKGFAYCENGKHRIGIGIHMSGSGDGECYYWSEVLERYVNVWYNKVKVHILEVSACDCSDVTDLGVQNLEGFFDFGGPFSFSFAILAAMRGDFVSNSACGEICGDYEGPPDECPEPPTVQFPVRPWPEICDPDNHTISDLSVECCGSKCECGPINCPVTFSVDGVEYTWNVTEPGSETFSAPTEDGWLCYDTGEGSGRLTEIQGCAICENGKYRIAVGVVMRSLFASGDCRLWTEDFFFTDEGAYAEVFYQKAKLHILEVSACDCTAITDLGVQEFEMFTIGDQVAASACLALANQFVSNAFCGEICPDYVTSPQDCPEPTFLTAPDPVSEMCDPASYTISDVSAERCGNEFP